MTIGPRTLRVVRAGGLMLCREETGAVLDEAAGTLRL
jgi:hypothetical protein